MPLLRALFAEIGRKVSNAVGAARSALPIRRPGSLLSAAQRRQWHEQGFLDLPGFFDVAVADALEAEVDAQWRESRAAPSAITVDVFLRGDARRIKLHDAPLEARREPYKLNDLYLVSERVRDVVLEQRLATILGELLGGAPLLCNTLNLEFGSEQGFHTDSLYMTPPKSFNMCAAWIAIEDCAEDAGPLRYYPGSHRITPFLFSSGRMSAIDAEMPEYVEYMAGECRRRGLREARYFARKGDVFLWHCQLFHGGAPIDNPQRTRKSLVAHYYVAGDLPCDQRPHGTAGFWMNRPHQPVR